MKKLLFLALSFITLTAFAQERGYKIGDVAANFKLKNIDGKYVSLSDYNTAKGFIVVFICNHCPYVAKYIDRINALNKKYKKEGYPVIAINSDDSTDYPVESYSNMQQRAGEWSITFPYLQDATQETGKIYGATNTPHVYVLQKENNDLLVRYIGAIDNNTEAPSAVTKKYVELAVDALLNGKNVAITTTKAIGCTIKFKN